MNKKLIYKAIRIFISITLIIFILSKINILELIDSIKSINIFFFLLALLTHIIIIPVRAFMWQTSLAVQNIGVPLKTLISMNLIAAFFGNFLPTSMGGDIVRAYDISKYSGQKVKPIATIIVVRSAGFFSLILFSIFGLIFGYNLINDINIALIVIGLLLLFCIFLFVIFNKDVIKKFRSVDKILLFLDKKDIIKSFYDAFHVYKYHKKKLFTIFLISLIAQLNVILYYYFITLSLHLQIPVIYLFTVVPIIVILEMLPISINGIGVREGANLFFFNKIGIPGHIAVLIGLIDYIQRVAVSLLGGVLFVLGRYKNTTLKKGIQTDQN